MNKTNNVIAEIQRRQRKEAQDAAIKGCATGCGTLLFMYLFTVALIAVLNWLVSLAFGVNYIEAYNTSAWVLAGIFIVARSLLLFLFSRNSS